METWIWLEEKSQKIRRKMAHKFMPYYCDYDRCEELIGVGEGITIKIEGKEFHFCGTKHAILFLEEL